MSYGTNAEISGILKLEHFYLPPSYCSGNNWGNTKCLLSCNLLNPA